MLLKVLLMLVGVLVVIVTMSAFGLAGVAAQILSANFYLIALAAAFQIIIVVIMGFRMRVITANCEEHEAVCNPCSLLTAMKITFIGAAVNGLTPMARVGGEPAKIYYLKKKGFTTEKASAVVATDTLVEIISDYVIVVASVIILSFSDVLPQSTLSLLHIGILFSFVMFILLFAVLLNKKLLSKTIRAVGSIAGMVGLKKFKEKVMTKDYATIFQSSMRNTFKRSSAVKKYFIISFFSKIFEFGRTWIIFVSLGIFLPIQVVIFVWSIILILSLVPWLPGNLGIVEAGGASAYVAFGIASATAAAGMLLERFMSLWLMLAIGLVIMWHIRMKDLDKIVSEGSYSTMKFRIIKEEDAKHVRLVEK